MVRPGLISLLVSDSSTMACILCIVTLMILGFAIQNIFGDTEHFLVSNSETGERRMWEETSMESRGRQKRNVGYQYGLTDDEIREVVSTHNEQRNIRVQNPTASNMRKMVRTDRQKWKRVKIFNRYTVECSVNKVIVFPKYIGKHRMKYKYLVVTEPGLVVIRFFFKCS